MNPLLGYSAGLCFESQGRRVTSAPSTEERVAACFVSCNSASRYVTHGRARPPMNEGMCCASLAATTNKVAVKEHVPVSSDCSVTMTPVASAITARRDEDISVHVEGPVRGRVFGDSRMLCYYFCFHN
jgi:hypothetical protein